MGWALVPLSVLLVMLGLSAQFEQQTQNTPGAGLVGMAEVRAVNAAQIAQRYAAGCLTTASATSGLIASSITVNSSIAGGATIINPTGSGCMTTAAGGGTRNVFAFVPAVPGAAARIMRESGGSAVWYRVAAAGQAVNLSTGGTFAVPTTIATGALVQWVQVNP